MPRSWTLALLVGLAACAHEKKGGPVASTADSAVEEPDVSDPAPVPTVAACVDAPNVFLFATPESAWSGAPLRVLAVTDGDIDGELTLASDAATTTFTDARRHGGPPYYWWIEAPSPSEGAWRASFRQPGCAPSKIDATIDVEVAAVQPPPPRVPWRGIWTTRREWSHAWENVYAAWIATLFDAPDDEEPSWPALYEVLRDSKRNMLFDHLGGHEDSGTRAPKLEPDCADLPYFLRAYFAFKVGLPFGIAQCDRGGGGAPPSCKDLLTNEDDDERALDKRKDGPVAMFGAFLLGTVADRAHSGSARAPFEDEDADYYPIPLDAKDLRPGTVYADPYGHTLMIAKRVEQDATHGGILFAVDGQPDGTVARKRFWRGNFLYAKDPALGGPGFKRFRPLSRKGGLLHRWNDDQIAKSAEYGDVSREAESLDVEAFYDRMEDVLSPKPLDAKRALMETIDALEEQVRTRVKSVDNGRKWLETRTEIAPMPDGAEIFETTGAWEDYSTPSRDLRLLIAIDVVQGFPARAQRRERHYAYLPIARDLQEILDRELAARSIDYTRTDGTPFTLTLAEVLARSVALEQAFNPNDCVEIRWGAAAGSDELSTCKVRAPWEQRARMETMRAWFHDRSRPPRK